MWPWVLLPNASRCARPVCASVSAKGAGEFIFQSGRAQVVAGTPAAGTGWGAELINDRGFLFLGAGAVVGAELFGGFDSGCC